MPASTFVDYCKLANAALREGSAFAQQQLGAKLNEFQQYLSWNGATPTAWDYPAGTTVLTSSTAVARSPVVDYGHDFYHKSALVRIVSTVGATPSSTVQIQGSKDGTTWVNATYADFLTPTVLAAADLSISTAATNIKLVPAGQSFRFLSVNVTADTNVTLTVDVTMLG